MNEFVIMTKKLAILYRTPLQPLHAQNNQGLRNAARGPFSYYKDWDEVAEKLYQLFLPYKTFVSTCAPPVQAKRFKQASLPISPDVSKFAIFDSIKMYVDFAK